jgi:hypothetical protein
LPGRADQSSDADAARDRAGGNAAKTAARLLGIVVQSLLLGTGLALALVKMWGLAVDAQVFRYVGF